MVKSFTTNAPFILLVLTASVAALSGSGTTTRYWDCCKPSCGWPGKAPVSGPVRSCDRNQNTISPNAFSACGNGGTAFTCANNAPWAVSDQLAYGFAAVSVAGTPESGYCCQCYQLTFTSGPAFGKTMVVQATNTGGDLNTNQFDLAIPGGGVGLFNACNNQYGGWNGGAQYGGVSSRDQCANLPSIVRNGCNFRFDWFLGSGNPTVNWKTVACPAAITNISGCVRHDQGGQPPVSTPHTSKTTKQSTTKPGGGGGGGGGSSGGKAPLYGQCGGNGWTGPTSCASGSCRASNPYYSQCLP